MKRNILMILLMLVLILVVWNHCSKSGEEDFDYFKEQDSDHLTENENWLRFQDESGDYSLQYPSNWELEDNSYKNEMIRADISREGHTGLQIRMIQTRNTNSEEFADSYIEQFKKEMLSYWKGSLDETERKFIEIGTYYGCRSEMIMHKGNGESWLFLHYVWLRDDYALVFQCGTKEELRSEQEPVLDQIAASLQFLK
ncbi:PsbP-related protein [Candidatus Cloacimonadota bacterium]